MNTFIQIIQQGYRAIIFLLVTILVVFFCSPSWWTLLVLVISAIVVVSLSIYVPFIGSVVGWLGFNINETNNLRFYFWVGCSAFCLLCGLMYGAGEPLMLSTWKETKAIAKTHNTPEVQQTVNNFLFGLDKDNKQVDNEKHWLKLQRISIQKQFGDLRPQTRTSETETEYNQKTSNWLVYNLFLDDSQLKSWLNKMPTGWEATKVEEKPETEKTWFFWKLFFLFSFISILYAPFAFSDEVLAWLTEKKEAIEREIEELKAHRRSSRTPAPPSTTPPTGGTSVPPSTDTGAAKFGKLLGLELSAEFIVNLLGALIRLFKKVTI